MGFWPRPVLDRVTRLAGSTDDRLWRGVEADWPVAGGTRNVLAARWKHDLAAIGAALPCLAPLPCQGFRSPARRTGATLVAGPPKGSNSAGSGQGGPP